MEDKVLTKEVTKLVELPEMSSNKEELDVTPVVEESGAINSCSYR